jgi:hypothetical protein
VILIGFGIFAYLVKKRTNKWNSLLVEA